VLALVAGVSVMIWGRTAFGWALARYWGSSALVLLRILTGIRTRIEGAENIPDGACILASKHMSDWDIYAILRHARPPAFIAKKELVDIPFFGHAARAYDTIRLDRAQRGDAIPLMLSDARRARDNGCRIIIFPEGTRKSPAADPDYRQGVVRLYEDLGIPVVPVALYSGLFWGRNSLVLWPGTARARFLPPIPPGLPADEFRARLVETIETETDRLLVEAYDAGLSRPLPPDLRARLERLKAQSESS
jgi:1-acyl-sn-glycerol-3-phosphate acyltransferase